METEEMAPPADVAAQLSNISTRDTALSKLERCSGPHAAELALAVAPPLGKLLVADAAEVDAQPDLRARSLRKPDTLLDFAQIGHFAGCRADTLAPTPQDTTARDTF